VIPRIGAGRLIRSASMAENIVKALCATNVNWTQAVKMINRLGQLGPNLTHFRSLAAWPTSREILRAGETYLKEVCRVGYRAESILTFCRDVCEERFDPASLDAMAADPDVPSEEIVARFRSINGIGPSSANYLLGFLGRHDHLSIDSVTFAHVAATHTKGRKPTRRLIERIYAPFGRWKNLVSWSENWLTWETAKQIIREATA
jgi:3-methyladenine DNA glycosylase/8-oxoguanine DNA glycosylase